MADIKSHLHNQAPLGHLQNKAKGHSGNRRRRIWLRTYVVIITSTKSAMGPGNRELVVMI